MSLTLFPHRSFWQQETVGDAPDAPPLRGSARAEMQEEKTSALAVAFAKLAPAVLEDKS